jgi:hypothetical protein
MLCCGAVAGGWRVRDELLISAEVGFGYWLGIGGLAMMVLLLLYSIRKRFKLFRSWGRIWTWFHIHMILGIVGPTLILFHANFKLGSLNSTMAMSCMILVASSGIIGRVIYTRIHHGLSGRQTTLSELKEEQSAGRRSVVEATSAAPELAYHFERFERFALGPSQGAIHSISRLVQARPRAWVTRRRVMRGLKRVIDRPGASRESWSVENLRLTRSAIKEYLVAVRRIAQLSAYERVFALWHMIHLPLTIMLFLSAAMHVVAVHMY